MYILQGVFMISLRHALIVTCVVSSVMCAQDLAVEELKKKKVLAAQTTHVVTEEFADEITQEVTEDKMVATCDQESAEEITAPVETVEAE
jgi:hypothetical protein